MWDREGEAGEVARQERREGREAERQERRRLMRCPNGNEVVLCYDTVVSLS